MFSLELPIEAASSTEEFVWQLTSVHSVDVDKPLQFIILDLLFNRWLMIACYPNCLVTIVITTRDPHDLSHALYLKDIEVVCV